MMESASNASSALKCLKLRKQTNNLLPIPSSPLLDKDKNQQPATGNRQPFYSPIRNSQSAIHN